METHIEATFMGHNAHYVTKQTYQLVITQHWRGRFTVTATHGYDQKPITDTTIRYGSLGKLLQDWHVVKVIHGGYE